MRKSEIEYNQRTKNPNWKDGLHHEPSFLYELYWEEERSIPQIARICNVCSSTIHKEMKKFNIPRRKYPGSLWRQGRIKTPRGIYLRNPYHPDALGNGYIKESRLIAEEVLGRRLKKSEVPHHINFNPCDNRKTNLLICSASYHTWLHNIIRSKGLVEEFKSLDGGYYA